MGISSKKFNDRIREKYHFTKPIKLSIYSYVILNNVFSSHTLILCILLSNGMNVLYLLSHLLFFQQRPYNNLPFDSSDIHKGLYIFWFSIYFFIKLSYTFIKISISVTKASKKMLCKDQRLWYGNSPVQSPHCSRPT